jgi:hypothetical protein
MRPFRSFLLLLFFLACFASLYYFVPGNLKLPGINEFIPQSITQIFLRKDSISSPEKTILSDTIPSVNTDTIILVSSDTSIIRNQTSTLIRNVIDSLKYSDKQVRIMYYGDSQIEGDRITSYLRQILRKGRYGTGPGLLLPLMPVMYSKSVFIRSSSNWQRYNYLSYKQGEIDNVDLGPFMALCRYMPPNTRSDEPVSASVRIVPSEFADITSALYDNLRIFYKNNQGNVSIRLRDESRLIYQDSLYTDAGLKELNIKLDRPKDLRIEFEGHVSPDIYGISIESDSGIVVDNLPQRGSAGMEFTMVGKENLKEIYEKLEPDLFILQYGLNIVRNIRDDYSYYESGLLRQLLLLKDICPGTPVLVVSLTDMAYKSGDTIRSYPKNKRCAKKGCRNCRRCFLGFL